VVVPQSARRHVSYAQDARSALLTYCRSASVRLASVETSTPEKGSAKDGVDRIASMGWEEKAASPEGRAKPQGAKGKTFRRREHQQGEREGEHLLLLGRDIGWWAVSDNRFCCASAMRWMHG
jgi:hypothetical protein